MIADRDPLDEIDQNQLDKGYGNNFQMNIHFLHNISYSTEKGCNWVRQ
jgi:hypothetical protein